MSARMASLLAFTATLVIMIYAVYLHFIVAEPPAFAGISIANIVAAFSLMLICWLVFGQFHASTRYVPRMPLSSDETPMPKRPRQSYWMRSAMLLVGTAIIYLRHTSHANDASTWVDDHWPIILPVLLAVAMILWLYDTCFARIINGSHSGRSAFALRTELVLKRTGVLVLASAGLVLSNIHMSEFFQASYRSPQATLLLAGFYAVIISFVTIER